MTVCLIQKRVGVSDIVLWENQRMFYPFLVFRCSAPTLHFIFDIFAVTAQSNKRLFISFSPFRDGTIKEHDMEMHSVDFIDK